MAVRTVVTYDDDIATAGTALADADAQLGDDLEVDGIDGYASPVLRSVRCWENSTLADATNVRTRVDLQMNTWPNTRRLTVFGRWGGIWGSAADMEPNKELVWNADGFLNIPVKPGDDWVSDASKVYSSVANGPSCVAFDYSYGQEYPWSGRPLTWIRKVADAAESAADVAYTGWSSDLTGTAPGLDPGKMYILRGVGHEGAATAKAGMFASVHPQASPFRLVGWGNGDFDISITIYLWDGILCSGQSGFTCETLSATAADTPYVWLGFEEYMGAGTGGITGGAGLGGAMPGGGFGGAGAVTPGGGFAGIMNQFFGGMK